MVRELGRESGGVTVVTPDVSTQRGDSVVG